MSLRDLRELHRKCEKNTRELQEGKAARLAAEEKLRHKQLMTRVTAIVQQKNVHDVKRAVQLLLPEITEDSTDEEIAALIDPWMVKGSSQPQTENNIKKTSKNIAVSEQLTQQAIEKGIHARRTVVTRKQEGSGREQLDYLRLTHAAVKAGADRHVIERAVTSAKLD
jgi:hypothetical protein